ncbi:hypothetical protein V6R86_06690 [Sphingomonas kaistensis]|uniref:DUF1330 domain-containing protein n=1 Tax=Sphingomonas kaistensis TaxID=298708 RepID=A0ABZ2G0E6_9SPHN
MTGRWDAVFVARYQSASTFLEMVKDEEYRHAVVLTSRLIRTTPREKAASSFG